MEAYAIRDELLESMGFASYRAYRESALWMWIRGRVLQKSNHQCRVCGDDCIQVHHEAYDADTLSGKSIEHLIAICATCHHLIEFTASGAKRSLAEANRVLDKLSKPGRAKATKRKRGIEVPDKRRCARWRCNKAARRGRALCRKCQRFKDRKAKAPA